MNTFPLIKEENLNKTLSLVKDFLFLDFNLNNLIRLGINKCMQSLIRFD